MTARKKPAKKRVRCKYRKGDVLDHKVFGRVTIVSTKKVGPKSFNILIAVTNPHGHREVLGTTVSEQNLDTQARKVKA